MDDNDFAENAIEPLIVEKAKDYRKDNPGLGCAKLYLIIKNLFESTGCMPGRDAFIELLRANGLMVQIKRRRHYKTIKEMVEISIVNTYTFVVYVGIFS